MVIVDAGGEILGEAERKRERVKGVVDLQYLFTFACP